ncbi:MAG: hypothetical protein AB1714_24405 [Acidobacteriota bacterium]
MSLDLPNGSDQLPIRPAARRVPWRAVLLGFAILVCGAIIGSSLTLIAVRRALVDAYVHPEREPERAVARMKKSLRLSDEQAAKVGEIVDRHFVVLLSIRREAQPRVAKELHEMKQEVEAVLNEEQTREWRKRFQFVERAWEGDTSKSAPEAP